MDRDDMKAMGLQPLKQYLIGGQPHRWAVSSVGSLIGGQSHRWAVSSVGSLSVGSLIGEQS
jgi:hypothetical protein